MTILWLLHNAFVENCASDSLEWQFCKKERINKRVCQKRYLTHALKNC